MNHKIVHRAASGGANTVDIYDGLILEQIAAFVEIAGRPDVNNYIPLAIIGDGQEQACIVCKPRAYKRTPETIGWAIAFLRPAEYDVLTTCDPDEIDGRLVGMLGLDGDDARYWTRRY